MSLKTIYVVRHGFRSSWTVDHITGVYSASIVSPTGIAADPALTSHGVRQAEELAQHLVSLDPPIEAIYSSPFYRCLQTIQPFVTLHDEQIKAAPRGGESKMLDIRPELGLGEFFGSTPFSHPRPATAEVLKPMFRGYNDAYRSAIAPDIRGETFAALYQRVTAVVHEIVARCEAEGVQSVILCTHAAVVIILGRVLTGKIPTGVEEEDFQAFTCGLSMYKRCDLDETTAEDNSLPALWTCEKNSDCSFLSTGAERGWAFSGDESFPETGCGSGSGPDPKL